jgi:hypothetical protein
MSIRTRFFLCPVLSLLIPITAHAWSYKEHIQLTRIAIERLVNDPSTPPDMKQWLQQVTPGLSDPDGEKEYFLHQTIGLDTSHFTGLLRYATKPDEHALDKNGPKVDAFGVHERQLHFIDLELFLSGDAKREYRDDLSGKPKLEDFPDDMKDPRYVQSGYLPLRVKYVYQQLVEAIRGGKLQSAPDQLEGEENSAVRWAGYLSHYLEDNTQPQHSTMDYKSASYFPHNHRPPDVHAQVEYRMADDKDNEHRELRAEYWPVLMDALDKFQPPIEVDNHDLFKATLQVSLYSYDALPMIGRCAAKAYRGSASSTNHATSRPSSGDDFDTESFFRCSGDYHGKTMTVMEMKAFQQAWAIHRVQTVLRQAWDQAHTAATTQSASR